MNSGNGKRRRRKRQNEEVQEMMCKVLIGVLGLVLIVSMLKNWGKREGGV